MDSNDLNWPKRSTAWRISLLHDVNLSEQTLNVVGLIGCWLRTLDGTFTWGRLFPVVQRAGWTAFQFEDVIVDLMERGYLSRTAGIYQIRPGLHGDWGLLGKR